MWRHQVARQKKAIQLRHFQLNTSYGKDGSPQDLESQQQQVKKTLRSHVENITITQGIIPFLHGTKYNYCLLSTSLIPSLNDGLTAAPL